jgi:acetyl-CoA C-acetyltransferase
LRWGKKFGDAALTDAISSDGLTDPLLNLAMGETAERIASAFQITREHQDEFSLSSQQRVAASKDSLRREIVPVRTPDGVVRDDELPRPDATLEKLLKLKPAFRADGTVTAGNSSGINDGAALILLAGKEALLRHALRPRARLVAATAVGCDPAMMGLGPVKAIQRLCQETEWDLNTVDAIEINEAFAAQTIACARELKLDFNRLNQRGGAIALGHPIGCSGARIVVTLLHLLEDRQLPRGIAAVCVGGGMGMAAAIDLVQE